MTRDDVERLLRLRREDTHESFNDGTVAAWLLSLGQFTYEDCRTAMAKAVLTHARVGTFELAALLPNVPRKASPPAPTPEEREEFEGPLLNGDTERATSARDRAIGAAWKARLEKARKDPDALVRLDRWTRVSKDSPFAVWVQRQIHGIESIDPGGVL